MRTAVRMGYRRVTGKGAKYSLISFDTQRTERPDDPDGVAGRISAQILDELKSEPITDIIGLVHGWKHDEPVAVEQYNRWIATVQGDIDDRLRMAEECRGFRPFYLGLHRPSEPFSDREFITASSAFDSAAAVPAAQMVDIYAERLGDTPRIGAALRVLFDEARENASADVFPYQVRQSYVELNDELDLGEGGPPAPPGDDCSSFDSPVAFDVGKESAENFGSVHLGGLLGPLRQLSSWTMKKRARSVGGRGIHEFLKAIQNACLSGRSRGLDSDMFDGPMIELLNEYPLGFASITGKSSRYIRKGSSGSDAHSDIYRPRCTPYLADSPEFLKLLDKYAQW